MLFQGEGRGDELGLYKAVLVRRTPWCFRSCRCGPKALHAAGHAALLCCCWAVG